MIDCNDLTIYYENGIGIEDVSLHVGKGTTCAIIGQSGCGKTTLLHSIAGLLKSSSGHVRIDHKLIEGIRKESAVILQNDGLFPWKNVKDNVAIALLHKEKSKQWVDEKVRRVLDELHILPLKNRYLLELSGGQRQRVAIARALVQEPDLLLMDEPTGALDMITKEEVQDLIMKLQNKHGMTMMLVTHDIEEAVFLGEKIIVMHQGKIESVIENPLYGQDHIREKIEFYELCLSVRQVLKR